LASGAVIEFHAVEAYSSLGLTGVKYSISSLSVIIITPWSRGLLEKLTVSQLVKKFPAFYGTRRFITAFTRAHHLSLP
jgi:hypothetical protein